MSNSIDRSISRSSVTSLNDGVRKKDISSLFSAGVLGNDQNSSITNFVKSILVLLGLYKLKPSDSKLIQDNIESNLLEKFSNLKGNYDEIRKDLNSFFMEMNKDLKKIYGDKPSPCFGYDFINNQDVFSYRLKLNVAMDNDNNKHYSSTFDIASDIRSKAVIFEDDACINNLNIKLNKEELGDLNIDVLNIDNTDIKKDIFSMHISQDCSKDLLTMINSNEDEKIKNSYLQIFGCFLGGGATYAMSILKAYLNKSKRNDIPANYTFGFENQVYTVFTIKDNNTLIMASDFYFKLCSNMDNQNSDDDIIDQYNNKCSQHNPELPNDQPMRCTVEITKNDNNTYSLTSFSLTKARGIIPEYREYREYKKEQFDNIGNNKLPSVSYTDVINSMKTNVDIEKAMCNAYGIKYEPPIKVNENIPSAT